VTPEPIQKPHPPIWWWRPRQLELHDGQCEARFEDPGEDQIAQCKLSLVSSLAPTTAMMARRAYPAISIGASAQGGSSQTPDNKPVGVIYRQPYCRAAVDRWGHRPVATTSWATRLCLHLRFPLADWGNPSDCLCHRHRSPATASRSRHAFRC
jgi:hypothetical protein